MPAPTFANDPAVLGSTAQDVIPGPLELEVRRIYERSPLYGRRFPLHANPLRWSCYQEIPALSKKDIVENGHQAFFADYRVIERGLADKSFEYESTSGTTSGPMTVIMEEGWWIKQTERAYLASPILRPFVGRPYRKCVLAPIGCSSNLCPYEDHPFPHRYFDGTVYLNLTSDPFVFPEAEWDRIVRELQATQPEVIEGEPVYLSLLARAVQKRGVKVPSVRAVILTYGKASLQHSRRIAEVFPAPQVDLYGSTEAGYLFVGEAFRDNLQAIDANAFIELVPWRAELPDVSQIYVTTRDRVISCRRVRRASASSVARAAFISAPMVPWSPRATSTQPCRRRSNAGITRSSRRVRLAGISITSRMRPRRTARSRHPLRT